MKFFNNLFGGTSNDHFSKAGGYFNEGWGSAWKAGSSTDSFLDSCGKFVSHVGQMIKPMAYTALTVLGAWGVGALVPALSSPVAVAIAANLPGIIVGGLIITDPKDSWNTVASIFDAGVETCKTILNFGAAGAEASMGMALYAEETADYALKVIGEHYNDMNDIVTVTA